MGVADGMGDRPTPEKAAEIVELVTKSRAKELSPGLSPEEIEVQLSRTIRLAHEKTLEKNKRPEIDGVSTATLVARSYQAREHYVSWATAGDS